MKAKNFPKDFDVTNITLPEGTDLDSSNIITGTYDAKHVPYRIYNIVWVADDCIDKIADKVVQKLKEDARPIVHGWWTKYPGGDGMSQCSQCGAMHYKQSRYCPSCGARMDLNSLLMDRGGDTNAGRSDE